MNNKEEYEFIKECVHEVMQFISGLGNSNLDKIEIIFGEGVSGFDKFFHNIIMSALNFKVNHTISILREGCVNDYVESVKNGLCIFKIEDLKNGKN
jgi:hypothetical protein